METVCEVVWIVRAIVGCRGGHLVVWWLIVWVGSRRSGILSGSVHRNKCRGD
jgi:hypothetical protein